MIKKVYAKAKQLHLFKTYAKFSLSNICINFKHMKELLNGLLIIAFMASIGSCQNKKPFSAMDQYFGEAPAKIIAQAEMATAYHIAPFPDPSLIAGATFAQFPILRGPIDLYDEELTSLKTIIGDSSSYYLNEEMKMCVFTPNLGIEFLSKNNETVRLLISFDCNVIKILDQNEEVIFTEDIDPSRNALKDLFFPIFKEEPYFQALRH